MTPKSNNNLGDSWLFLPTFRHPTDFRWHDLRHTWASWHAQSGTPLHVLQELGGWSNGDMVKRYAHLSHQQLGNYASNVKLSSYQQNIDDDKTRRRAWFTWSQWRESNLRPTDYESVALPTELHRRSEFFWRLRAESNRSRWLCRPLHNRFATQPKKKIMNKKAAKIAA